MPESVLDVRHEPPVFRYELITHAYNDLQPGGSFVLINDHDPMPRFNQLMRGHPGDCTWDYLERGPHTWRVRIGRPLNRLRVGPV
ncbi:MAG: DUF2249 domain-containing protein [Dermatophilus congolensis]|nr:DUF2249 domain-containing protein [Dermatophilus congolensis]